VRQAISRLALLHDNKIPEQMLGRLKALAEAPFPDYVVVNSGVTTSDTDNGYGFTLHTRYKVKEMMFNGKLEY